VLVVGMAVIFAGYTVGSYGWVLLKGWDIPFRQWVSPLNPYQWPAGGGDPPPIPSNQLFPSSAASAGSGTGEGSAGAAAPGRATMPAAGASGAPGTVPVRSQ